MPSFLIQEGYLDREKALATSEANKIVRELTGKLITNDKNTDKDKPEYLIKNDNEEESR